MGWKEIIKKIGNYVITYKFFRDKKTRLRCKKLEVDYFSAQILRGRGKLNRYLTHFKIFSSKVCSLCQDQEVDDVDGANHTK
ncbi:hypothetical protein RUM43_008311, partial [Polyplax serrata]